MREIHPRVSLNFSLSKKAFKFLPSCGSLELSVPDLFTVPLKRMTDLLGGRTVFAFINVCCFLVVVYSQCDKTWELKS